MCIFVFSTQKMNNTKTKREQTPTMLCFTRMFRFFVRFVCFFCFSGTKSLELTALSETHHTGFFQKKWKITKTQNQKRNTEHLASHNVFYVFLDFYFPWGKTNESKKTTHTPKTRCFTRFVLFRLRCVVFLLFWKKSVWWAVWPRAGSRASAKLKSY